jgi:hypothetical protein
MPVLPCPNCATNILAAGFHNTCSETVCLREDNYTYVVNDHLYIDHDEKNHETVEHECDVDAYCSNCDELLPWPLYQIRGLDGAILVGMDTAIAKLVSEAQDQFPNA